MEGGEKMRSPRPSPRRAEKTDRVAADSSSSSQSQRRIARIQEAVASTLAASKQKNSVSGGRMFSPADGTEERREKHEEEGRSFVVVGRFIVSSPRCSLPQSSEVSAQDDDKKERRGRTMEDEEMVVVMRAGERESSVDDDERMGDDGYPLLADAPTSSQRSRDLARIAAIDRVIEQQSFDQELVDELGRASLDGEAEAVREESPEEETNGNNQRSVNLLGLARNALLMNEDGSLTSHGEIVYNNYRQRQQRFNTEGGDEEGSLVDAWRLALDSGGESRVTPSASRHSEDDAFGASPLPAHHVLVQETLRQAARSSLKERISFMYCNPLLADVYFLVGQNDERQRIPAHKFVLSIGSAVFDAMFSGRFADGQSTNNEPVEVELPDVEPSAFLTLLKFLYSDDVSISPDSVMTTLYTAKKYAVPALEGACVDFLKAQLGADNAFLLLTQARLFDEPQLASLCMQVIDKNTHEALAADGFVEIDVETLCAVLGRDSLRVREVVLFQALIRWATEQCERKGIEASVDNKRAVMGRALSLIRFPLMTVEEFAQTAAQSGLLSDKELVNLFLYFTVNPKPSTPFNDHPRSSIAGKELVVSRFQRIEGRWGYSGTPDRIKFTVDRRIFVIGFGLHGSIHGPHEYQVNIQIIHCGTGKVLASNDTSFTCDGSSSTFRVCFQEPVEITPSVTYIASACLRGPDSHYGTKGLRRVVHACGGGGAVTFQFTYAAGNNNGTSVEDGQIPEIIFYTKLN